MNEEALHTAWSASDRAQRVQGVPLDPDDLAVENELIAAIREYEAAEDYQRYLEGKRNGR